MSKLAWAYLLRECHQMQHIPINGMDMNMPMSMDIRMPQMTVDTIVVLSEPRPARCGEC